MTGDYAATVGSTPAKRTSRQRSQTAFVVDERLIAKALIETVGLNVGLPIAVAFVPRFSY